MKENLNYADTLSVVIQPMVDPLTPDGGPTHEIALIGGVLYPAGYLERAVRAALAESGVTDTFVIDSRRNVSEWGASGAVEELVLSVLRDAIGVGAGALLVALAGRLRRLFPAGEREMEAMSESDAAVWARGRVALTYNVSAEVLELRLVRTEGATVTVRFCDRATGWDYTVKVAGLGAGAILMMIERTAPAD